MLDALILILSVLLGGLIALAGTWLGYRFGANQGTPFGSRMQVIDLDDVVDDEDSQ